MNSDTESLASNMSDMSIVSYTGKEMTSEEFIDQAFADIQTAVNHLHCATRNMMQCEERGDSYEEDKEVYDDIQGVVKEGVAIFREIAKTNKQMLPKAPKTTSNPHS